MWVIGVFHRSVLGLRILDYYYPPPWRGCRWTVGLVAVVEERLWDEAGDGRAASEDHVEKGAVRPILPA